MHRHDVIIIGGGISGSAALHWLARGGADALLIEERPGLGGVIASRRNAHGALCESGPNSMQAGVEALRDIIVDLGIEGRVVYPTEAAANRYIMRDGRLVAAPTGPKAFLRSNLFSAAAKRRVLRERFVRPVPAELEESVAQFVTRRLGAEVLEYAMDPFIAGIYAGRPEQLSLRYCFPKLHELEQTYGSLIRGAMKTGRRRRKEAKRAAAERKRAGGAAGAAAESAPTDLLRRGLISFDEGMAVLPRTIQQTWSDHLRLGCTVESIERAGNRWRVHAGGRTAEAEHLVIAAEAYTAARLVAGIAPELASVLGAVQYPPIAVAAMLYPRTAVEHPLDGFGVLFPCAERRNLLGAIFSSTLFPGRAPEGTVLITAFAGGARAPEAVMRPPHELEYDVHAELRRTLGISARPISCDLQLWQRSIPQYTLGYGRVLDAVAAAEERHGGLHFLGNYRGGVSVGECVASAHALAGRIVGARAGRRLPDDPMHEPRHEATQSDAEIGSAG